MISESSKQLSKRCKMDRVVNFDNYDNNNTLYRLCVQTTTVGKIVERRYIINSRRDFVNKLLKILDCRYFWMREDIIRAIREARWA